MLSCAVHRSKDQDPRERPVVEFVSVESVRGTRPANKALICEWFKTIERPKGVGMAQNGTMFDWFHGQYVERLRPLLHTIQMQLCMYVFTYVC